MTTRAATALGLAIVPILAAATLTAAAAPAEVDTSSAAFDTTNTGIGAVLSLVTTGDLGDVAVTGGWTGTELASTLIDDPRLFVVHDPARQNAPGAAGYAEPLAATIRQNAPTAATAPATQSTTVAQVMSLHSRPGSSRVIFLDFDGHTTSGTWWNDPAPIVSAPFDRDGNTASFSAAEIAEMEGAWRVVAEDYALFNVDVTTQDPGVNALSYDGPTDQSYGMRVVISGTDAWVGGGIGGIAWLGSFGWAAQASPAENNHTPAFVFTTGLFNYKDIGDAVSHEAGHTFGLAHDGALVNGVTDPYYQGTARWAPIMGVSYDAPLSQWSNGGYPGANNTEDDLATIAGKTGYRIDDYPNTTALAATVTAHQIVNGFVGGTDQADVFAVNVAAGPLDVTLSPSSTLTSNLFATVVVRDAAGAVVATDTPTSPSTAVPIFPLSPVDWRAHVAPVVPAGKYTIFVVPAGLQPGTVNGFTSYGAHGGYTLTVAGRDPGANTAPVARAAVTPSTGVAPLTAAFSGLGSTDVDGDALTYTWYDGTTLLSTSATTQQTYATAGTYSLRLVVTDAFGATNESVATVVASAAPAPAPPPTTSTTTPVPATPTPATPTPAPVTSPNARLSPVTPVRLADTRSGLGGATRLPAGGMLRLGVAGANGVPSTATAVALNLTAVSPATAGFLTVYPCSATVPVVSTVNFVAGKNIANATIATLSDTGEICVAASTESDVLIDLTGWFAPSAANAMTPRNPTRYLDTRSGLGGATRLAAGSVAIVDLPPGEAAVAVNVIAVSPAASGYLTVYPCGNERPNTSSVNFDGGEVRANNAIVATGVGGDICVFTLVESDVVVDLTGTFSASGTLAYRPAAPHRLLDTRDTSMPASGATVPYDIPSPGVAFSAASVNVTATDHTRAGFVTTFDCGPLPVASTVNTRVGEANANGAIVPVASSASCLYSSQSAQLIVDLLGWWVPA